MPEDFDEEQIASSETKVIDRLVSLATDILDVQAAAFVARDHASAEVLLKHIVGPPLEFSGERVTLLFAAALRVAVASGQEVVVSDIDQDHRFSNEAAGGSEAITAVPVRDRSGQTIGVLCALDPQPRQWTATEVSRLETIAAAVSNALHLNEMALRSVEAQQKLDDLGRWFSDLASNVPGAIFRYVEHPDGRTQVQYMSPGCYEIWEVPSEAVMSDATALWEAVLPEDRQSMVASVRRSAERQVKWQHRWRIQTPSGQMKWLEGYGRPMQGEAGTTVWNSLILDVTTEVQAQERLIETTRLLMEAAKQETIGRLAAGIAHDFNNLLSIAMGNTEVLIETGMHGDGRELLEEIRFAAARGGELTRRLLSFARRSTLAPEVFDLNEAVSSMAGLIRRTIGENIRIENALMAGLWRVRADRSFLESSLLNLCLNARDAMPKGGRLTIETANVRITEDYIADRGEDLLPGRYVMLAVSDTGEGIDPPLLPMIFEPFFTNKGFERGSGMGLAMVFGFMKQSGGTIRVYSELGYGSAFKLYFPATPEDATGSPHRNVENLSMPSDVSVLWVEDEAPLRKAVAIMLRRAGVSVVEAPTADDALELFLSAPEQFELILTDVVMPGSLSGPDFVRQIRAAGHSPSVIFVSGYPHEANVHGNGIGVNDIALTKPFSRDTLLIAIARLINMRRVRNK